MKDSSSHLRRTLSVAFVSILHLTGSSIDNVLAKHVRDARALKSTLQQVDNEDDTVIETFAEDPPAMNRSVMIEETRECGIRSRGGSIDNRQETTDNLNGD